MCQQLHDNRGRDIRHYAECKQRHSAERPATKHVEHVQYAATLLLEQRCHYLWIYTRYGDVRTQAENDHSQQHKQQPLSEFS